MEWRVGKIYIKTIPDTENAKAYYRLVIKRCLCDENAAGVASPRGHVSGSRIAAIDNRATTLHVVASGRIG
jgi:hypothetical protein